MIFSVTRAPHFFILLRYADGLFRLEDQREDLLRAALSAMVSVERFACRRSLYSSGNPNYSVFFFTCNKDAETTRGMRGWGWGWGQELVNYLVSEKVRSPSQFHRNHSRYSSTQVTRALGPEAARDVRRLAELFGYSPLKADFQETEAIEELLEFKAENQSEIYNSREKRNDDLFERWSHKEF